MKSSICFALSECGFRAIDFVSLFYLTVPQVQFFGLSSKQSGELLFLLPHSDKFPRLTHCL
jgi:hypothetical protein